MMRMLERHNQLKFKPYIFNAFQVTALVVFGDESLDVQIGDITSPNYIIISLCLDVTLLNNISHMVSALKRCLSSSGLALGFNCQ